MKKAKRIICSVSIFIVTICVFLSSNTISSKAANREEVVEGTKYIFGKDGDYNFSSPQLKVSTTNIDTYGEFSVKGNIVSVSEKNGVPSYGINGGKLLFKYAYSDTFLNAAENQTHLVDDKNKIINDITLDNNIMKGALVLQTSRDGQIWYTDTSKTYTNMFKNVPKQQAPFYEATDVQMANGCYYRIVIAYKTEIKTGSTQYLFIKDNEYEYHKIAEVYTFYAYDQTKINVPSPADNNKHSMGEKTRKFNSNGYGGEGIKELDNNDPHNGWDIGQFYVGGYTSYNEDNEGNVVFLKNNGNKVSLWFDLKQNIDKCGNNPDIRVVADKKGSDAYFEVPGGVNQTMDFGRGTLIVRKSTNDGIMDPQVYTNFLEASASPDADTKIDLFEEGDYEVALDYEIQFDETKFMGTPVLPQTGYYRVFFKFLVRNGNTVVYLFDSEKNTELSNGSFTKNGFKIDLAGSKYLNVNVKREILKEGVDGLTEDTKFNSVATDGDVFTDDGVYTITVKNPYNESATTVKRVYVGDNKYLRAYITTGKSIKEIKDMEAKGATIMEDGTIVEPTPTPTPTLEPTPTIALNSSDTATEVTINLMSDDAVSSNKDNAKDSSASNSGYLIIIGILSVVIFYLLWTLYKKNQGKENSNNVTIIDDKSKGEER